MKFAYYYTMTYYKATEIKIVQDWHKNMCMYQWYISMEQARVQKQIHIKWSVLEKVVRMIQRRKGQSFQQMMLKQLNIFKEK